MHATEYTPQLFHLAALSRQPEARDAIVAVERSFTAFARAVDDRVNTFETSISAHEKDFSETEQKSLTLKASIEQLSTTMDAALADWHAEYTNAQIERAEAYSKVQIERGNKFIEQCENGVQNPKSRQKN